MGTLAVKPLQGAAERERYFHRLLTDIAALEQMLQQDCFDRECMRIGAEQEFCLVTRNWEPSDQAVNILKDIQDPHFTSELTRYNLEANLDPLPLSGKCFSRMHEQLNSLMDHAQQVAEQHDNHIILTGILPTIGTHHLSTDYMTPVERYKILNEAVKGVRGADLDIHIKGVDEVNLNHDSIMYEGCNTSFQAHLQIDPDRFADTYNWAQAISGPILSICTNSPMLMGRELWEETRIALFTQSVDTRKSTFLLNEREPRVGFGTAWASGTPADFFKKSIVRFRSLISTDFEEANSLEVLREGGVPRLAALNLHNGTVYPWNRLCYGRGGEKPHLRIENRYLPSGPTTADEIANLVLWVGVMSGKPRAWEDIHTKMDFRDAKKNFFNAARYGMAAQFHWDGKIIPARELLRDFFLPMAYQGLTRLQVDRADIERYLKIIENRIGSHNGSEWMVQTYRELRHTLNAPEALRKLTACLFDRSFKGYPVDAWKKTCHTESPTRFKHPRVGDLMSTRIVTAQEEDSAALVVEIMKWNGFHHLPILNGRNELSGLLSWTDVAEISDKPEIYHTGIRALMRTELITIGREASAKKARKLMNQHQINCLPVVEGHALVGILTSNDLP
ncbi:CBS domain-containing protein [Robiginitalea sp. M366]|uniref:CBS domain-containing protein n=1 Tax=Robiginitalea aestuariiviva TaxID=3036903 RepID=UPI00240E5E5A|nr:CBS domain-containing protein [Robiginitalea aestuariiviva]MDG1571525.1 CBS domain-containing protein [Robiginitalea aestuariiviva]